MALKDALNSECIAIGSDAKSKDEVLRQMSELAANNAKLAASGQKTLYKLLKDREKLGSTGFGGGVAIPHAFIDDLDEFVVGVLVAPEGVPFESADEKPATVLVFIFGPSNRRNEHVRLLSTLSTVLGREGVVRELCSAKSPEAVRESILRHEEPEIWEGDQERSMVLAFVQDEDCFERILQVFSASMNSSVSVLEASNARAYLHRMPVFSAFWSDSPSGFQRIVVGIVERQFGNDIVRRIHTAAGSEGREAGLLVAVQDLSYCSGQLNF